MKAKEIVLLICIIIAGVFLYHVHTDKIHFKLNEDFFFIGEEFVYEESREFDPPFPPEFQILNAHGDIEIQGNDREKITVLFRKQIWRRNKKEAEELSAGLQMSVEKDPVRMVISTNREKLREKTFKTHFKVLLPAGMDVAVTNSYGAVEVSRTGKTALDNRHGKTIARNISGPLELKNSYKNVEVENVHSDSTVESKHSTVSLNGVEGRVQIVHRHGKIHLKNIARDLRVEASHSEISGQDLKGRSTIETSYEKVVLFDIGPAEIRTRNAAVEVKEANGPLKIENRYGKVRIHNLRGNLLVDGKHLEVKGQSVIGEEIQVSSSYQPIELREFSGKTTIFHSHGDIVLAPDPLTHPIEVNANYASIKFHWPRGKEYPLEARVKNGDIQWRLPGEITFQEKNHLSIIRAFPGKEEMPSIFLSTSYRTIWIGD